MWCSILYFLCSFQIPRYIPITDLEDCCKEHDICYGTCNKNKDECDEKFKKCLYKICSHFEKMISKELLSGMYCETVLNNCLKFITNYVLL